MIHKPSIPRSELEKRIELLQNQLKIHQYDALIIPLGVYFYYFFGKEANPSERLIAGIISDYEDPFIIAPKFEKLNILESTYIEDVVTWDETESPYLLLAKELDQRKIGDQIAVDPRLWYIEVEYLRNASKRNFKPIPDILYSLRSVKSSWEIEQLKNAAKYSSIGILQSIEQLKSGMTELELRDILSVNLKSLSDNPMSFGIVQFGENSAIPHGRPSNKKLRNDDVVLIDAGTSVNGYHGDITITVPFGKPKNFIEIYDIVYEANRSAFSKNEAGAIPAELDNIARSFIKKSNYGKYFTHRLGHGIGLDVHETPYIVGNNSTPLTIGNTHTIEPGIYQPNKFGIRIEDDVYISKDGARLLYNTPRYNFD